MTQQRNFWMRWRVRVGYPVAILYWLLARPTPRALLVGALIAALGLLIRGAASGHLRKYEELCTTGPYAYSRNPLYFGSAFLAAGFVVAGDSWRAGTIVAAYFACFYYAVMRNEERDLASRYGPVFDDYAAHVPLFFPRPGGWQEGSASAREPSGQKAFSWRQYRRNREYRATLGAIAGLGILWLRMWLAMQERF